ncbi:MAG: uracil-DNA glycosylase [Polyangiaceae bacterium]
MSGHDESLRTELRDIASALRTYLEWHEDAGGYGLPREARRPTLRSAPFEAEPKTLPRTRPVAEPPPPAPVVREGFEPFVPPEGPITRDAAAAPSTKVKAKEKAPPTPSVSPSVRLPLMAQEVASCTRCGLSETRNKTVFSRGNPEAKLLIVGEAPGADEDAQGLPFVGKAGQLLDKMIGSMGLDPQKDVYVCNVIKCRPPGNRKPTPEETNACLPYLQEQLSLVSPQVILAMGNTAVATLLGTTLGITKLRGQWKLYRGTTLLMPTYHPSYLLREGPAQKEAKKQAWSDLQAVMKELGLKAP